MENKTSKKFDNFSFKKSIVNTSSHGPLRLVNFKTYSWMHKRLNRKAVALSLNNYLEGKAKSQPKKVETNFDTFSNYTLSSLGKKKVPAASIKAGQMKEIGISNKLDVKPHYLFSQTTMRKIEELRELFLEFDEDNSRTLDLNELHKMFNANHIPISSKQLQKFLQRSAEETNKKDIRNIDFYKLVLMAISTKANDEYRDLVRKFKIENSDLKIYLPMTFNKVLEHLNDKSKLRINMKSLKETVDQIDLLTNDQLREVKATRKKCFKDYDFDKDFKFHKKINLKNSIKNFEEIIKVASKNVKSRNFDLDKPILPKIKTCNEPSIFNSRNRSLHKNNSVAGGISRTSTNYSDAYYNKTRKLSIT